MAFNDLVKQALTPALNLYGAQAEGVTVIFTPRDYSGPQTIDGIISPPPLEEQDLPGMAGVVYFFVRYTDITPNPKIGDKLSIDGATYNIDRVKVDIQTKRNAVPA